MGEDSILQVPTRNGGRWRWKARSIAANARRIVLLCLVLLAAICLAAIGSIRNQSAEVDFLVLAIGPAVDTNSEIFRDMNAAKAQILEYQLSRDPNLLATYRITKLRIEDAFAQLRKQVMALPQHSGTDVDLHVADLETIQTDAAERWLAFALSIEDAVISGDTIVSSTEIALFEGFRRANSELDILLESERDMARSRARTASDTGTILVIAVGLATLVAMLVFGLGLARSISKPVIALSGMVKSQREGDLTVRAREDQGSAEIRDLARDFNLLVENEAELDQIRSLAQRMHGLTVKIEHAIRGATNTRQAHEILCIELGTGLDVDRVLTTTIGADLQPILSSQWHRSELPSLGALPDELIPHVGAVSKELWKSSGHLVFSDRLAPGAQSEGAKAFYRYTDARASLVVPVGVGDQVLGMIHVVTTTEHRVWTEAEVNAVDRVAAFLAQFIVEQTYRDQLNEHVERLEQLNRQKDTFVATVSHELRTPLTSIIGYLEVLKDGYAGDLTEEQARMLDVMDRNAIRLLGLIQDLLALNKRESEAGKNELVNVSMPELITTVCQELSPLAESGAIKVECEAGPPNAVVQGDRGKLQSAVVNIVSNAIKFSPRGGVVTIGCTLDEPKRQVQFTCQDRGIGIPAVDQGQLFTRFYRASNAMTKFIPGTGLGLTIVKQIVDDHGGEIRLDSVEGEGTTVVIDLPLSPQDSF